MIRYARQDRNRPANFYGGDPHDTPMPIDYFNWVITNDERTFVVDTGFDAAGAIRRGREMLKPIDTGLAALGLRPDTIENVIITHMHYDHAGNTEMFPAARYHIQESEMSFVTGKCMCHELLRHPFEEEDVVAMVRKVFAGRVDFYDGDYEIAPGISLHRIGGHSRGLQSVRVKTARGPVVLASDAAHYYEHLEQDRAFAVFENLSDLLEGYRILRRLAPTPQHIVPGHDPQVFQRYPAAENMEGWAVRVDLPPIR
nr:N-acyl homoserine lactonase family protein [Acuticoccus mangrovi]